MKICQEIPDLIKIGKKYQALAMNTKVRFIVAGDIKFSLSGC